MQIFKHTHPSDLLSRLFILEYMREIGAQELYEKANKYQKQKLFYKFTDEDQKETVDINYEFCLFMATLYELEVFLKLFLEEIKEIDKGRKKIYKGILKEKEKAEQMKPVDINIMDLAQTEIKKSNSKEIIV